MVPQWDVISMLLYIILGCIAMLAIRRIKLFEYRNKKILPLISWPYLIWFLIWEICSVWRYVGIGIGGSDAITYVDYFENCINPNYNGPYANHLDIGFQIICKIIRLFTNDYHIFFFLIYGFIIFSYQLFIKEFCLSETKFSPLILLFFIYLRGFTSIRTNLSVAVILVALVLLQKNRFKNSLILLFFSCMIHKASIIYAAFVGFYLLYKKGKIKIWHGIVWCVITYFSGKFMQNILIFSDIGEKLNGAYSSYAARSLNKAFFYNTWKIAFGQLMLLGFIILLNKRIRNDIKIKRILDQERFKMIYLLCLYDFLMIPVCHILGIWRGYEYFYVPRLIMWGEIIWVILNRFTKRSQRIIEVVTFIIFLGWMVFRVYNTWESSALMPYIFEPFYYLFK